MTNKNRKDVREGERNKVRRTDDLVHKRGRALFDVWMPKGVIGGVARAVEYMEGGKRIYGSRCFRCERGA